MFVSEALQALSKLQLTQSEHVQIADCIRALDIRVKILQNEIEQLNKKLKDLERDQHDTNS